MPSTTLIFERYYDKPPPTDCLGKCNLNPMCFHPCWESCTLLLHTLFLCQYVSQPHEFTGGQAGSLAWTEMNTCWDQSSGVWFAFLFQSPAFFFLLSLTHHSHLSLLCLLPYVLEKVTVSNAFCTKKSPEDWHLFVILYLWLWWFLVSLPLIERISGFCLNSTFPSFLLPFFMSLAGYHAPCYSNLVSMLLP